MGRARQSLWWQVDAIRGHDVVVVECIAVSNLSQGPKSVLESIHLEFIFRDITSRSTPRLGPVVVPQGVPLPWWLCLPETASDSNRCIGWMPDNHHLHRHTKLGRIMMPLQRI